MKRPIKVSVSSTLSSAIQEPTRASHGLRGARIPISSCLPFQVGVITLLFSRLPIQRRSEKRPLPCHFAGVLLRGPIFLWPFFFFLYIRCAFGAKAAGLNKRGGQRVMFPVIPRLRPMTMKETRNENLPRIRDHHLYLICCGRDPGVCPFRPHTVWKNGRRLFWAWAQPVP